MIEWLGGHVASLQGETTTILFSAQGVRKKVVLSLYLTVSLSIHLFIYLSILHAKAFTK